MAHPLYDIHPIHHSTLHMMAHPGGGTEVVEVPSFEGLVEDQYESHLKHIEVAIRPPAALRLANLILDLNKNGSPFADKIKSVLNKVGQYSNYEINEMLRELRLILEEHKDNFEKSKMVYVTTVVRSPKLVDRGWGPVNSHLTQLELALSSEPTDWKAAQIAINWFTHHTILHGTALAIGEVDMESNLGEAFDRYLELVNKIKLFINKNISNEIQTTRSREIKPSVELQTLFDLAVHVASQVEGIQDLISAIESSSPELSTEIQKVINRHAEHMRVIGNFVFNIKPNIDKLYQANSSVRPEVISVHMNSARNAQRAANIILSALRDLVN